MLKKLPACFTRICIFLPVLIFLSQSSYAQTNRYTITKPQKNSLLPLDKSIRIGKLPNGFTYIIRHNETPKNRVLMFLANKVGSILENDDQRGLAHFMEHMSFDGTTNFPKTALVDYLQKSGVRFGADLNAYTSFDETVYQLPLPSDNPVLLKNGLQILRDWASNATLGTYEINRERGVVLEEKRTSKGAGERVQKQIWPVLLNNSRYANRLTIGTDEVLNNFKPETLREFYKEWYRPDLQALIVVGDINVDDMEQMIKKKFGDLKNPVNEKKRIAYSIPLTEKNQFIAITDKEITSTGVQVIMKSPALAMKTVQDYRLNILQSLFNQLADERFTELRRRANPPFITASLERGNLMGGVDQLALRLTAKPGELENGFKAAWSETNRIKTLGFTQTEFVRAKQNYLINMDAMLKDDSKHNSDDYMDEYLLYFLKDAASPGVDYEYTLSKTLLPKISLKELNDFSSTLIKNTDRDVIVIAPEKDKSNLPDENLVIKWMQDVAQQKQKQYNDEVSNLPLLNIKPTGGKIVNETKDTSLNITTITFDNGVKVILKPTEFDNNEILFNAVCPGGSSVYEDKDFQSASNAVQIISASGLGNYDETELSKYLSLHQSSVTPYISERSQGVDGSTTPGDMETAMSMVFAYYTQTRKDSAAFSGIIAKMKAGLTNRAVSPEVAFRDTIMNVLGNHNSRRTAPSLEKANEINFDKALSIYKERFENAEGTVFTFVGNFKIDSIKPLLVKYIGSLPATHTVNKAKDLSIHAPEGQIEKIVYKGTEPKANVFLVWSGVFDYSLSSAFTMDALRECLQIKLLQRLRQQESGVYSPSVAVNVDKTPHSRYSLSVNFSCAPENVKKLIASTIDEVGKIVSSGAEQGDIEKWRAETIRIQETDHATNDWWLSYIGKQLRDAEPINQVGNYSSAVKNVSVGDTKHLAEKYFSGNNFIQFILIPENFVIK